MYSTESGVSDLALNNHAVNPETQSVVCGERLKAAEGKKLLLFGRSWGEAELKSLGKAIKQSWVPAVR